MTTRSRHYNPYTQEHYHLIDRHSPLWAHTQKRIDDALAQARDHEHFKQKMVTRLYRMTDYDKVRYALEALQERGYEDVVEFYHARLVLNVMSEDLK